MQHHSSTYPFPFVNTCSRYKSYCSFHHSKNDGMYTNSPYTYDIPISNIFKIFNVYLDYMDQNGLLIHYDVSFFDPAGSEIYLFMTTYVYDNNHAFFNFCYNSNPFSFKLKSISVGEGLAFQWNKSSALQFLSINSNSFMQFVDPSIMQVGLTNGGYGPQWNGTISFPHSFSNNDDILVFAMMNGTNFDNDDPRYVTGASVYCYNVNATHFDYKKTWIYKNNYYFTANVRTADSDSFNWLAVDTRRFNETGNQDIIKFGYSGYIGWNGTITFPIPFLGHQENLVIITTLQQDLDVNAPDIPSISIYNITNSSFDYSKHYVDNILKVKDMGQGFVWMAIDKTKINELKNIWK